MNPLVVILFVLSIFIGYNLVDDFDASQLKGKNVVVTGASSGIGEQMAYHYARFGANVLLTARSEARLQKVIKQCEMFGHETGKYLYLVADMSDMSETERLIEDAGNRLGSIDFLVLNHISIIPMGSWIGSQENLTYLHRIIDVNFLSYVHLASNALKLLESSSGSIVVVSSVAGRIPQPYLGPYSASKFALEGFFGSLRQDLIIRGVDISVTLCIIGLVDTQSSLDTLGDMRLTNIFDWIPFARADDVAMAIVKSGAKRERELAFPYLSVRFSAFLTTFCPRLMEIINRFLYTIA